MNAFILLCTVILSVGLGIGTAYSLIVGILQAFAAKRPMVNSPSRTIAVPVMLASESQASGD